VSTAPASQDSSVAFSARIRAESAAAHRSAEESTFVSDLLDGRLPLACYTELLAQTYFLYEALEDAGQAMAGDPVAGPFVSPELLRRPALAADLELLAGADWRSTSHPLPATERYCRRLRDAAHHNAPIFIAHHYIRYLGDLSGGQIIRRSLKKVYGLDHDGVRFYIFDAIPKPKLFKDAYRAKLDNAPLSEHERDLVVHEVIEAFALNRAVFDDLAAHSRRLLSPRGHGGAGVR
jgi:heme oxygenase